MPSSSLSWSDTECNLFGHFTVRDIVIRNSLREMRLVWWPSVHPCPAFTNLHHQTTLSQIAMWSPTRSVPGYFNSALAIFLWPRVGYFIFYIIGADILRIKLLPDFNLLSSLIHTYHFLFAAITFTNLAIPSVQAIVMYRSPASVCTIRVNHLFPWQLSLGEIAHILLLDVEFWVSSCGPSR